MEWTQFLIIFLSIVGMWLSGRSDWKRTYEKIEEHRRETFALLKAIQDEIKDFHGRLCAIEERTRK